MEELCCGTCKYNSKKYGDFSCDCEESERCGDYTDYCDYCDCYEEKEEKTWN